MPEDSPYRRFIDAVRERLSGDLPGAEAQLEMAPAYRRKPVDIGIDGKSCSEAAVLALFYPDNQKRSRAKLLLTVRPDGMAKHAGQDVGFTGQRVGYLPVTVVVTTGNPTVSKNSLPPCASWAVARQPIGRGRCLRAGPLVLPMNSS